MKLACNCLRYSSRGTMTISKKSLERDPFLIEWALRDISDRTTSGRKKHEPVFLLQRNPINGYRTKWKCTTTEPFAYFDQQNDVSKTSEAKKLHDYRTWYSFCVRWLRDGEPLPSSSPLSNGSVWLWSGDRSRSHIEIRPEQRGEIKDQYGKDNKTYLREQG